MLIEMMGWVENVSTLPKLRKRHICIKRLYADGNQSIKEIKGTSCLSNADSWHKANILFTRTPLYTEIQ